MVVKHLEDTRDAFVAAVSGLSEAQQRFKPSDDAWSIAVHPHIALNSAGAAVDAALRGSGICRPLSYQVVDHIAEETLAGVPVLAL